MKISIIGTGYVGLTTGTCFAEHILTGVGRKPKNGPCISAKQLELLRHCARVVQQGDKELLGAFTINVEAMLALIEARSPAVLSVDKLRPRSR